jgi:HlyD family secretion protein
MKRRGYFALALLIGIAGTAASMTLIRAPDVSAIALEAPPTSVAPRTISALGRIESSSEERDIAAVITGKIKAVYVDEGDTVSMGQIIAELEGDDLASRLKSAEARVRLREAELQLLQNGARPEERQRAKAQVEEMEAGLVLAEKDFSRRERLTDKGAISMAAMDESRSSKAAAEARRAIEQLKLDLILAPPRQEYVAMAEAQIAIARADVAEAKANLDKTLVRSPIDGTILRRYRLPGETVSNQVPMPIVRIGDASNLRVRAEVDETDIAHVSVGARAYVTADAYGTHRFPGSVTRVGSMMGRKRLRSDDPAERIDTKALEVLIELDNNPSLPIGLRVDAFIVEEASGDRPLVIGSRPETDRNTRQSN